MRVAVGWFGGNCGSCLSCREGDFIHCERLQIPGDGYPGGCSELGLGSLGHLGVQFVGKLIAASRTAHGHPSGTARDTEETLRFAALTGVRLMTEFPALSG